ncbi:DUF4202 domain-containing protein [Croceitalea vernalis]|uniref:DUF4202 domain-containing protein n=1 Tax=Croceitalea vernalis TaxID=3075599 RepID=A0ABU3BD07_9FLAO|nr:DUF4202 domain-containing protein [Croceitalea sp. P007]MDT0620362.1 DUF4202 domain-containing protein [Croceitalea sp. P007]
MVEPEKLLEAFRLFDEANSKDPNSEAVDGIRYPKEVLYASRMTETLNKFEPNASESLRLTAHCQHICRWEIPRNSFEMNRAGYLKWRQELKKFHVKKAKEILTEVGYSETIIAQVAFLLLKKQLKKSIETQTLEDVICLVFLQYYFEPFTTKHNDAKIIDILQKTWRKMSEKGRAAALKITFSKKSAELINQAISN